MMRVEPYLPQRHFIERSDVKINRRSSRFIGENLSKEQCCEISRVMTHDRIEIAGV